MFQEGEKNKASHVSGVMPWLFIKRDATWAQFKVVKKKLNTQEKIT